MEWGTKIIWRFWKNICIEALEDFGPQIIFYVAGADPYHEDQLGGLALTMRGIGAAGYLVMDYARRNGCPVAITLAGGYARRVEDTVAIHVGTILAMRDAARGSVAR